MKLRSQDGFTGVDIAVAIVVIFIFVSIIAILFYNLNSSAQEIERKSQATYYAIEEIEKVKNEGFTTYAGYSKENYPPKESDKNYATLYRDGYIKEKDENGKETGKETSYYKSIKVEDYSDIEGNEGKLKNLVKKVTVTVSYKFKTETREVSLSTVLSKEN